MQSDTIRHKVKIFISSKIDARYTIVRKALEELLLETGLTSVYNFETAAGSSMSMPDAYLQQIEDSHLCLFLVDNKDGVTDPVLAEYQRAKSLKRKIICLFCDENEKTPTQLEEEYKKDGIGKYCHVHEFADFTKQAYETVLQDIVNLYRNKLEITTPDNKNNSDSTELPELHPSVIENSIIHRDVFRKIDKTKNELVNAIFSFSDVKNENTSDIDDLSTEFLQIILCNKKIDSINFHNLCEEIIKLHHPQYKDLMSERLKAVEYYLKGEIDKCIVTLKDILHKSEDDEIAPWFFNDVAIDLRNALYISDETSNIVFSINNEGQKYIDKNPETVFFPLIDRLENNIHKEISNQYYMAQSNSPYTTILGGQTKVFHEIAEYFFTALTYGSVTHLMLTRSRIIDALTALCFMYSDHDLFVNLVKMLIIERKGKDLEKLIRTYNQPVDIVNSNDVKTIRNCIDCIPIENQRLMSEFLLLEYFGYYFSDSEYEELSTKLILFSLKWIDDPARIFSLGSFIFKTILSNLERLGADRVVELIIRVLSMEKNRWYDDALEISSKINFNFISETNQLSMREKSIDIITNNERKKSLNKLEKHLLNFKFTSTINTGILDDAIRDNMADFYNKDYQFIIFDRKNRESILKKIESYIGSIEIRNKQQGRLGTYYIFGINPYLSILNIIINNKNLDLGWDEIIPIISCLTNTLKASNQRYSDKCDAILLLIGLKNHFIFNKEWNEYITPLINSESEILIGNSVDPFEKDSKQVLYFSFQMLLYVFDQSTPGKVINSILSITKMSDYEVVKCLKNLDVILKEFNFEDTSDQVIMSLIYLASVMTNHKELDIRFYATKCLIQLTHSKYRHLVLPQLSSIMDTGTSMIKASIISRVKNISDNDNSVRDYIIQKGKVDNNYLVRKVANSSDYQAIY